MAGHRRVNGRLVCPDDNDDDNMETPTPSPRRSVRLSPHPREQQTPQPSPSRRLRLSIRDPRSRSRSVGRERTVSLAPTITSEEYYKTEDESYHSENDFVKPPTPHQRDTRLGSPLASIFTAPRSEIEEAQQIAESHGLYTGTVYKPRKIKEEESQRWVVVGRDLGAVDRLVDYQRKDVARQLELEPGTTTLVPTAAGATPPITVTCNGPSTWKCLVLLILAAVVAVWMCYCSLLYL